MTLSWEEFKKQKRKEFGTDSKNDLPRVPAPRYDEIEIKPQVRRFNIHKRSLPPGIDKIVVYNCPSREAAEHTLATATDRKGNLQFATKVYHDSTTETKTYVYYDVVPVDATPKERSIFANVRPITTEEIPGFEPKNNN